MMEYFKLVVAIWSVKIAFCLTAEVPGGYYNSRYDSLDIDDILNHKRLVYHYAACFLNRGPCPPQALDLKRILPEALTTNCGRCTEKQKVLAKRTFVRLETEYPSTWKDICDFYDPSGDKFRKFLEISVNNENSRGEDDFENNIAGTLKPVQPTPNFVTSEAPLPLSTMIRRISQISSLKPVQPTPNFVTSEAPLPSSTMIRRISQISYSPPGDGLQILEQVIRAGTQVADMVISTLRAFAI